MLDYGRKLYADQFEPDGDGFLYRRSSRAAPIRVTAEERARYIAAFNRWLRYSFWGLLLGMLALITVMALYFPSSAAATSDWIGDGGVALICALYLGAFMWAWNAPARELRGRGAVGDVTPRSKVRRQMLAGRSYWQILGGTLLMVLAILKGARGHDLMSGWNRLWLVALALTIGLGTYAIFLKWRSESSKTN